MWNRGNIEDAVADEYGVLYSKDGKRLLKCKQLKQGLLKSPMVKYHVREGTKVICSSAFSECETFEKIIIPNSVETIEYGAFRNCMRLTEVTMESAQEIDDESIYRFRVRKGFTVEQINETKTTIGSYAFADCTSLRIITIGNTVKEIGPSAFHRCISLKVVNYNATACISAGDSEHYFYHYIFEGCDNLTKINIGRNVRTIPPCLFGYCKSLPELNFPGNIEIAWGFECCTSLKRVTIGNGENNIADGAFRSCEALTEVIIGNGLCKIGSLAFADCKNLTKVTIGNSSDEINGWEYSGRNNFWRINAPNALSLIGHGAFSFCSALTEVTIADGISEIGMEAFDRCTSLSKLHLGKCVTKIGGCAFASCKGLKELTIPDSVTEIGFEAFFRCTGLTSVYSLNPEPPTCGGQVFEYVDESTCVLYVPEGAKEAYSKATDWKDFTNIVEI